MTRIRKRLHCYQFTIGSQWYICT